MTDGRTDGHASLCCGAKRYPTASGKKGGRENEGETLRWLPAVGANMVVPLLAVADHALVVAASFVRFCPSGDEAGYVRERIQLGSLDVLSSETNDRPMGTTANALFDGLRPRLRSNRTGNSEFLFLSSLLLGWLVDAFLICLSGRTPSKQASKGSKNSLPSSQPAS